MKQGAESAAPSYNFVEELEATVNEVRRSGVSGASPVPSRSPLANLRLVDLVVARLSRVFDDASSRLSHAARTCHLATQLHLYRACI